ncbi:unnamed protein product [Linum trigynum]|uniref:Uncharacterized protein n=1 Tax=Linum trigynum TaxID=586398 RepID=A0AAV2CH22_9ROSI
MNSSAASPTTANPTPTTSANCNLRLCFHLRASGEEVLMYASAAPLFPCTLSPVASGFHLLSCQRKEKGRWMVIRS